VSSFRDSVVLWVDRRVQESAQVHLPNDDPPLCEAIDVLTENTLVEKLFRMLSAIKKLLKTREWVLLVWFAKLCDERHGRQIFRAIRHLLYSYYMSFKSKFFRQIPIDNRPQNAGYPCMRCIGVALNQVCEIDNATV